MPETIDIGVQTGIYGIIHANIGKKANAVSIIMGAPGKDQDQVNFIASKVDHLFRTITRPGGKPYTYQQVSDGSGLNLSYIRKLRVGKVANPSRGALEKLSKFFSVSPEYWFRTDDVIPAGTQENHQVGMLFRKIADSSLTEEQLRVLNEMVDALINQLPDKEVLESK